MTTLTFIPPHTGRGTEGRLRRLTIASVAVAAVGATGVAVRALVKRSPAPEESAQPAADIPGLTEILERIAMAYGDRDPVSVEVTETTRGQALALATSQDYLSRQDHTPAYLVVIRGRFTALTWQTGTLPPRGSYLFVVLDHSDLSITHLSLSDEPPAVSLTSLGSVTQVEPAHS